jgi:hypothetical protein
MIEITTEEEFELKALSSKVNPSDRERQRRDELATKYSNSREAEFIEKFVKPLIPNFRIGRASYIGNYRTDYKSVNLEVSPSNRIFRESDYYFEPSRGQKLVHFTSLKNLKSIIESQCLWLRPLDSMEDPNEMFTLAQNLGFSKNEISDFQEDYFSASFNLFAEDNCEEWIFWTMYGKDRENCSDCKEFKESKNGTGVALVFTLKDQDVSKWSSFHCSKIHYDFDQEFEMLKGIKEKAFAWMDVNEFRVKNLSEVYLKIMAFHKDEMWKFENEIRILFHSGEGISKNDLNKVKEDKFERRVELQIGSLLESSNQDYMEKGYEECINWIPQLQLSSIILGPKIKDFESKKLELESELKKNFPYPVEVRKSKFYDYFNPK